MTLGAGGEGGLQPLLDRALRPPAEAVRHRPRVEHGALHLARPRRRELGLEVIASDRVPDALDQIEHAGLDAGADVERTALLAPARRQQGGDDIGDVDVVPGLLARAEDRGPPAVAGGLAEDRDDAGLGRRVLAWSIDV